MNYFDSKFSTLPKSTKLEERAQVNDRTKLEVTCNSNCTLFVMTSDVI